MSAESKSYTIYHLKTGRAVARLDSGGMLQDDGDPVAVAELKALMQRDIVVRGTQIGPDAETAGEEYEPFPEENMCYFGVVTLRPGDPSYLAAFIRRLPYISYYEARPDERKIGEIDV